MARKKSDLPSPAISVRLTKAQRWALARVVPDLSPHLALDKPNARSIELTTDQLALANLQAARATDLPGPHRGSRDLRLVLDAVRLACDRAAARARPRVVYQFAIVLQDTNPSVWRRIQVPHGTLDRLHEHIQNAMGWTNSHLHDFVIDRQSYGDPLLMQDNFIAFSYRDSTITTLAQVLPEGSEGRRFIYRYDFGDDWHHRVLFEGCHPAAPRTRYPVCLEGASACPPEDVGGTPGFEEFLEAISNRRHKQHREFLEWAGPYDPEAFDPAEVTTRMQQGLFDWRKEG